MKRRNYSNNRPLPTPTKTSQDSDASTKLDSKRAKLSAHNVTSSVKVKSRKLEDDVPKSKVLSSYEMSESGACKVFIETIQYELDGLLATMSTPMLRRHCAWKLVEICTSSIDSLHMLRAYGISNTLLRIAGLLISEPDSYVRLCIQFLTLAICRDERGGINPAIQLPLNVFEAITQSSIRHINRPHSKCEVLSEVINTPIPSSVIGSQRRKFGVKSNILSPESLPTSNQHLNQAINTENCDIIFKELSSKMPKLCSILLDDDINDNTFITNPAKHGELIELLGQTIINRFLIAKIQNSKTGDLDTSESTCNIGGLLTDSKMDEFSSYQSSMRNYTFHSTVNDGETAKNTEYSLLQHICIDMVADITTAKYELENNLNKASPQVLMRLWQGLGIIEAACFRCLENQIHINSFAIPLTRSTTQSKHNFLLHHLMSLLKTLTPVLQVESETKLCDTGIVNSDEDNLHGLFPELCIKLNKGLDSTVRQPRKLLKISIREVWLSCLRALVNLTTGCSDACAVLLHNSEDDVEYLFSILALCLSWKNDENVSNETTEKSSVFSALETALQKTAFDGSLFILTILTNLFESEMEPNKANSITKLLDMKLMQCLNKATTGIDIDASNIKKLCCALTEWSHHGSKASEEVLTASKLNLIHFLLALLARETSSFLSDIIATDDDFSKQTKKETIDNRNTVTPTDDDMNAKTTNIHTEQNENLPLAEIIIAAHLILLLHVIDSKVDNSIRKLLPRGTWWLGIRVLKAFLVLQGQSGVLVIDSAVPVLAALQSMKSQDSGIMIVNTPPVIPITDTLPNEGNEIDNKISASNSKSNKGKWIWDSAISDFVWIDSTTDNNPPYSINPQKSCDINAEIDNENEAFIQDTNSYFKQVLNNMQKKDSKSMGYGKKRKILKIEDIDNIDLV